nr:MAG TPA_asm: hypothetical protein [Caudoviricetes sp.]
MWDLHFCILFSIKAFRIWMLIRDIYYSISNQRFRFSH